MERANVVLADTLVKKDWEFLRGLEEQTNTDWTIKCWDNAGLKNNKLFDIRRFAGYFSHPFEIFLNRKKYATIAAWQQFYGLIFAFYCNLFRVKKINHLVIMTFIYKKKSGIAGRIYKAFISSVVCSKYIDKLVVFSESEVKLYAEMFGISEDKFQYFSLGIQTKKKLGETNLKVKKPFLLSVGRSNRDYDFLFECVKDIPYQVVVLTDSINDKNRLPSNIMLLDNVRGDEYLQILAECYAVLIPLKDPDISSGQLVMLQAMQYEKPIIITEAETISDYVKNGINAIVCKKDIRDFKNAIQQIIEDDRYYKILSEQGLKIFNEKFSLLALGKKVGKVTLKLIER